MKVSLEDVVSSFEHAQYLEKQNKHLTWRLVRTRNALKEIMASMMVGTGEWWDIKKLIESLEDVRTPRK